jgi:PPM family protein phosphatase
MRDAGEALFAGEWPVPARSEARLCLTGAMQTHPGAVRTLNADAVAYVLPDADGPLARSGALALVADGMGGHAAGEVASRLAADIVCRRYYDLPGTVPEMLSASLNAANAAIYQRGLSDERCAGMGTTCTVVVVQGDRAYLGHIGDSRAYLLRGGLLRQISQDHSVVAELIRGGKMTIAEASRSPYRNLVLRALGTRPSVEPVIWREGMPLYPGDVIVLCSDGLSDVLEDFVIADLAGNLPPAAACRALLSAALAEGGTDNISLGVFAIGTESASAWVPDHPTRTIQIGQLAGGPA